MKVILLVCLPLLFFTFVGWGIFGLVADKIKLRPPGILLATGYAISNALYFVFYFLFGGNGPAMVGIVGSAILLNIANIVRLKRRKVSVFASLLPNFKAEMFAYALFLGVVIFSASTYVSSGVGQYWHTANEDVFDGLFGRNAYLSDNLAGNEKALDVDSRIGDEGLNKLHTQAGIYTRKKTEELFRSRYIQDLGALQYSSLALISNIINIKSGMDAFVIQSILNLGLFSLGVYAFVRHIFGQPVGISILAAAMSACGNFYLTTYLNGHIGSMMYNAVVPLFLLYVVKWIRDQDAIGVWLLIPISLLIFVLGAYPFPLPYVVAPLLAYAALQWQSRRTASSLFDLAGNRRVLLLVCILLLLAFLCSYYLAEPLRFRAINQFRSWGTSINYVGFLQFWGVWFSGLTYTASPLGWAIAQPSVVYASVVLAAVLSLLAIYGFYLLLKQRVEFVLVWLPIAILFFFVMRFAVYDSYYFYKFLYINAWVVISATVIGFATSFRRFWKIPKYALMCAAALWIGVNLANDKLAFWLVLDKKFNTNAGEYQKILGAPVPVLNETFIAIPQQDHADLVKQILGEQGIKTRKTKRDAKYLLHALGVSDITYEPIGEIVWRSNLFIIAKKLGHDVVELSSFWSPEGGSSGADRTRQQMNLAESWAIKLTGLGASNSSLFRWVTDRRNSAVLIDVSNRSAQSNYLYLCGESGPGVGHRAVKVHVTDAGGSVVGDLQVGEYACQSLDVAAFKSPFLLDHNEVGEYSSLLDRRKLIYRIMKIGFSSTGNVEDLYFDVAGSQDIIQPSFTQIDSPVRMRLGGHWHPFENYEGENFRWVDLAAEIYVSGAPGRGVMQMEVAPGPSAGKERLRLDLVDERGDVMGSCAIMDRTTCEFPVMLATAGVTRFKLTSDAVGLALSGDTRILNFRVFNIGWQQ